MPNWEQIRNEWETTKTTFKALVEKHDVKEGTLKSRRSREKWTRNKDATKKKKDATIKKVATPKEVFVESDDLNDKQRLFCIYYIKYFNATKAYQKAYECAYSTAMVEGHRHLRNPKINSEIDRMKEEQTTELKLTARDVLQKYIDIALADITDFVGFDSKEVVAKNEFGEVLTDDDGNDITYYLNDVNFKSSDEVDGTIITEVKQGKDGVSLKLADKMKAMDMLAKYTDLLSNADKKRLQEEKLKAEVEQITKDDNSNAPPIITIVDAWSGENG